MTLGLPRNVTCEEYQPGTSCLPSESTSYIKSLGAAYSISPHRYTQPYHNQYTSLILRYVSSPHDIHPSCEFPGIRYLRTVKLTTTSQVTENSYSSQSISIADRPGEMRRVYSGGSAVPLLRRSSPLASRPVAKQPGSHIDMLIV